MKTKISLSPKRQKLLADTIRELALEGRFYEEKRPCSMAARPSISTVSMWRTSAFSHGKMADPAGRGLPCERRSAARLFLYDWHESDASHRLHGFRHPGNGVKNATRDYALNQREKNTIARHMFPLTPIPPQCREAWLVCLADKWCAMEETLRPAYRSRTNMLALLSRRLPKVPVPKTVTCFYKPGVFTLSASVLLLAT